MTPQPREHRRPYRAGRRAEAAAETRKLILGAALRLFVEYGYGQVTVGDIAREAGTAVPTVYASTGGKTAILVTLLDEGIRDPIVEQTHRAVNASSDPREAITIATRGIRTDNERYTDLLHILVTAAALEKTAGEALARADRLYNEALRVVAVRLGELEALRPGMDPDRATDILWFFLGRHSWRLWVEDRGWSWDETEEWLSRQVTTALLGERFG